MQPIIETKALTHIYSAGTPFEHTALDSVDFCAYPGEYLGIIGHTGSGKSTLIQHLNALLKPTAGTVLFQDTDIWSDPKITKKTRFQVGLVFQYPEYQLFEETVYKDISFGPKNMGLDEKEIDRRVRSAAYFVGLRDDQLEKSPFELSGGQKRRVAIAGVIAMEPKVLILDEPTAGLDPKGRDHILGQIVGYHKETGRTVLIVSHSMEDVAKFANKVLVMNQSRMFCYDDVKNVFSRSEEIAGMGLAVPQITRVFVELARRGYPVDPGVYTVEQAKKQVMELMKGGEPAWR